jgi:shikimate dehydrogenase
MKFGLIGYPLSHSFSRDYFTNKFHQLGLAQFSYDLMPIAHIEEVSTILRSDIFGLNVTIPYKQSIIQYINDIDPVALSIGAVNTLVRTGQYSWKGFNTDCVGFLRSLKEWIGVSQIPAKALILGSGGASRAVAAALSGLGIKYKIVSRSGKGDLGYDDLTSAIMKDHLLIINTTPVGMYPDMEIYPAVPYEYLCAQHWVYDLIYNPGNTLFLQHSQQMGARVKNGLDMLHFQADCAWSIWKNYGKF